MAVFVLIFITFEKGLGGALEDRALIAGGLPDFFERAQPVQMRQAVAVFLVALVVVPADAMVFARVAHEGVGDVGLGGLGEPAAQPAFFQRQMFGRGGNEVEMFDELGFGGGETPVGAAAALVIHPSQQTEFGVGIQAQPGYTCLHKRTPGVDGSYGSLTTGCYPTSRSSALQITSYVAIRRFGR